VSRSTSRALKFTGIVFLALGLIGRASATLPRCFIHD